MSNARLKAFSKKQVIIFSFLQVHVGEYGVHWNFFFTLAAVSILTSFINISPQYWSYWFTCTSRYFFYFCLILMSACLLKFDFHYLLSDEIGMDIISQNKEGIFSIFDENYLDIVITNLTSIMEFCCYLI